MPPGLWAMLRDWGLALLLAVGIFVAWVAFFSGGGSSDVPTETPALQVTTLDGQELDLAALEGEPVVINFWATWCGPCKAEIPDLQAYSTTEGAAPLIGVSTDDRLSPESLARFVKRYDMTYPIVHDRSGGAAGAWGVSTLPTTFVLSPDGHITARHTGMIGKERLERLVAQARVHAH